MKRYDAVASLEFLHASPDFDHRSREFVAQNLRRIDEAMPDFLNVRSANTTGSYTEQQLSFSNFRNGDRFKNHAIFAAIYTRTHFGRKRFEIFGRCDEMGRHTHVAATISDCERSSRALSNSR